jgi:two-component SAPR family response regulator
LELARLDYSLWQYSRRLSPKPESARTWPFKVFVLGRFQVLKDDAPIRFPRRQQRKPLELLQALIAFGGTEVGAGKLTDALWPDSEGDAGYHALENSLYRLRRLLDAPSVVVMAGGKLTLDRRQVWVDMWAFESELRAGNADDSSPAERLARLRELYSGHFLAQEVEKTRPCGLKYLRRLGAVKLSDKGVARYSRAMYCPLSSPYLPPTLRCRKIRRSSFSRPVEGFSRLSRQARPCSHLS